MFLKFISFIVLTLLFIHPSYSMTASNLTTLTKKEEGKLEFKQIFTEIIPNSKYVFKKSFSKEAIPSWALITTSSALLFYYDEEIYAEGQRKGRDWGIGNNDNTESVFNAFGQELIRLPTDTGSFLYFLGDGWMHAGIGGAFLTTGHFQQNNYTFNTGMMIWHGMVISTIYNQLIKRSWGRESPNVSTHTRGNTKPFPSFKEYNTKTGSYDAVPSGHVMTATLTFTILSERYPEYRAWIYPTYGVWASLLMFQMVNNGVHWASDYPLGIAMGYIFGKAAARMTSQHQQHSSSQLDSWKIIPSFRGIYAVKKF